MNTPNPTPNRSCKRYDEVFKRQVVAQGTFVEAATGTGGAALGQVSQPVNISVGERGVYVADTGNGRIQSFDPPPPHSTFSMDPTTVRFAASAGLSQPAAVVAVDDLTNELFYVADTGNDRVVLFQVPDQNTDAILAVWNSMTNRIANGDFNTAASYFSIASADQYRRAFLSGGAANIVSAINQIGTLTPIFIKDDTAEYYFEQVIAGQTITFPVEFVKENDTWKILEF